MIKKFYCPTCQKLKRRYEVKIQDDTRTWWYECKWCHEPVEFTNDVLEEYLSKNNKESYQDGYENGYNLGYDRGSSDGRFFGEIHIIDKFVSWAYVQGIDFSFMGKIKEDGTSDVPDRLEKIKQDFYKSQSKDS